MPAKSVLHALAISLIITSTSLERMSRSSTGRSFQAEKVKVAAICIGLMASMMRSSSWPSTTFTRRAKNGVDIACLPEEFSGTQRNRSRAHHGGGSTVGEAVQHVRRSVPSASRPVTNSTTRRS